MTSSQFYSKKGTPFQSIQEFKNMILETNLVENDEELGSFFTLSMQIYPDEITHESHFKMSFIEFLEAISRAA